MAARAENNQFKYHTTDGSHAFKVAVLLLVHIFVKLHYIYAYPKNAELTMDQVCFLRHTTTIFRN